LNQFARYIFILFREVLAAATSPNDKRLVLEENTPVGRNGYSSNAVISTFLWDLFPYSQCRTVYTYFLSNEISYSSHRNKRTTLV
jgi:hypothetical protein